MSFSLFPIWSNHYDDVIMSAIASQITTLAIVYSTVYSDADQRKHRSSASLAFVRWIHRGLVKSPHKGPVTRKMFPIDDVIMNLYENCSQSPTDCHTISGSSYWDDPASCQISLLTSIIIPWCSLKIYDYVYSFSPAKFVDHTSLCYFIGSIKNGEMFSTAKR